MDPRTEEWQRFALERDRYGALRWLKERRSEWLARLGAEWGSLPALDPTPWEGLAESCTRIAIEKLPHFEAARAPDFGAWLIRLVRPQVERLWFLGWEEPLAEGLRRTHAFLGDAVLEEVAVWSIAQAIRRAPSYCAERGSLKDWVRAIARHRAASVARLRRNQRRELELERCQRLAQDELLARDLQEALYAVLRGAPRTDRLVLRARVLGVEYPAIAERLGMSVPSVHNAMSRSRGRLQRWLEREERL